MQLDIRVCIGSSCHQKSSYAVMKQIRSMIRESGLENSVTLSSAFCLGHCSKAVTIKIDDEIITGVGLSNIAGIFEEKVAGALR